MGRLEDGRWTNAPRRIPSDGSFVRKPTTFRQWIRADGSTPFAAEAGRYHLYVSWACPWAHRTLIMRSLKGLEDAVSISITHPFMGEQGWTFDAFDGSTPDHVNGVRYLWEIYVKQMPDYSGRVTVPVLWDKHSGTLVSNESREIIRMFDHELAAFAKHDLDLAPAELHAEIDAMIDANYESLNNGVYRSGFARSQEAYEKAVTDVFRTLDRLEGLLSRQRYLLGDRLTEADLCLFTTLYRFDAVYYSHFKCNVRRIVDYPALWRYTRDIYQMPAVRRVCRLDHVKLHYYSSHESINPTRIVPVGPALDYDAPVDLSGL